MVLMMLLAMIVPMLTMINGSTDGIKHDDSS